MKVLLASLSYLPSVGGLVSYLENFGRFLNRSEHEVRIVCSNRPAHDLPDSEIMAGIPVRRVHAMRSNVFDALFKPFVAVARLVRGLRTEETGADLVLVRHLYLAAALLIAGADPARVVYLVPLAASRLMWINRDDAGFLRKLYTLWLIPQVYLLEWWVLRRLDHVAVLSESKRNEIQDYYRLSRKPEVIPPGIDLDVHTPVKDPVHRRAILTELGRPEDADRKIILTVCRLVAEKNTAILLEALSRCQDSETVLYVVGDGPLAPMLAKQAVDLGLTERVVFFGYVPDPTDHYRVADLFVLPSTYEGFGHVFLEALACDVPVAGLGHNPPEVITATDEIISPEVGYVVRDNTASTWAAMMDDHFRDGGGIPAGRCREYARKRFSWDQHLRHLLDVVERAHV
ncbi:hypothetical protein CSB20_12455 [bacterium DOLZORAL124_64_63]|nr:MAG: hypothetical protein CSB20_12455 [bacterium DOLZORAL124_64_63]